MIKNNLDSYQDTYDNSYDYDDNSNKNNVSIPMHYYHIDHENDKKPRGRRVSKEQNKIIKTINIIICVFIALIGLLNISSYPQYIFGFIFFICGFYIGNYIPVFGLIFLFSHGGTGFFFMLSALLANDNFNVIFTKLSDTGVTSGLGFLVGLCISLGVIAFILCIVDNLLSIKKDMSKFGLIPLILFAMFFLLINVIGILYI